MNIVLQLGLFVIQTRSASSFSGPPAELTMQQCFAIHQGYLRDLDVVLNNASGSANVKGPMWGLMGQMYKN